MQKVQRKLGIPKIGFLGTLDPAASGVLVLLCGNYTKRADELHQSTKVYQSQFTFGIETDTLDAEGQVIAKSDVIPSLRDVVEAIQSLIGNIEIEIPKFSAVHINGKRAYDLARSGVDFTPPTKTVKIHRFELLSHCEEQSDEAIPNGHWWFEIEAQTGTYIRSLAKLLAQKLNTLAIASTIIRTRVGNFKIEDAKSLEEVTISDIIQI